MTKKPLSRMAHGDAEYPLVSLIILTYNQAAYVSDAVRSALAQDYSPLEILVSDDCSTDGTIAAIEKITDMYGGHHKVKFIKREKNLGLIPHLNALIAAARGEIIVLSAGDDISLSHRTCAIVEKFLADENALLVHTDARTIDDKGNSVGAQSPQVTDDLVAIASIADSGSIYIGATGAIHRRLFEVFGPITECDALEDLVMGFRARLLGGLRYLPEQLVDYRIDVGLSSYAKRETNFSSLRLRYATIMLATLRQRRKDVESLGLEELKPVHSELSRAESELERIKNFHTADPIDAQAIRFLKGGVAFAAKETIRRIRFDIRKLI